MKRAGLILVGVAAVALPIGVVAHNPQSDQSSKPASHVRNGLHNTNNSTVGAAVQGKESFPPQASATEKRDAGADGGASKHDWWTLIPGVVTAIGTLALAIIGVFATCAAFRTLGEIKEQTGNAQAAATAASQNAQAALLNAQAVINSERPWLVVEVEEEIGNPGTFIFRARNRGRTPAKLAEGHYRCELKPVRGFSPTEEDFGGAPFIAPLNALVIPNDAFDVGTVNTNSFAGRYDECLPVPVSITVYGKIVYWDTFANRNATETEPHETRWCFAYNQYNRFWYRSPGLYTKHT